MTYQKILVALSRPPTAAFVFEQALEQATPNVSQLTVVHTLRFSSQLMSYPATSTEPALPRSEGSKTPRLLEPEPELNSGSWQQTQRWLESCREQAHSRGVRVEIDCRVAEPGLWICELAQMQQADLIVLGGRAQQHLGSIVLGSVATYVMQHAPCTVLIVQ